MASVRRHGMMKNKSGQLFIISGFLVILGLFFIYSLETENYYIISSSKSSLLSNIVHQTCEIGRISNGSYIDSRFSDFETNIENYCPTISASCNLTISKSAGAPTNLSELDYTYYNYSIAYEYREFSYSGSFNC